MLGDKLCSWRCGVVVLGVAVCKCHQVVVWAVQLCVSLLAPSSGGWLLSQRSCELHRIRAIQPLVEQLCSAEYYIWRMCTGNKSNDNQPFTCCTPRCTPC
jgi:hypothetical protein